jgi:hypothetical protein
MITELALILQAVEETPEDTDNVVKAFLECVTVSADASINKLIFIIAIAAIVFTTIANHICVGYHGVTAHGLSVLGQRHQVFVYPEGRCSVPFDFKEENWWNGLDILNQMLAEQESTGGEMWACAHPSVSVGLVFHIERHGDGCLHAPLPFTFKRLPAREFAVSSGVGK